VGWGHLERVDAMMWRGDESPARCNETKEKGLNKPNETQTLL